MPCFYFDKRQLKNTPSFNDGVEADVEAQNRRDGARFIINAGNQLGLRHDSYATGVVYYQRFFMFHSFKQFNKYIVASACLFLAAKVEETPKKCRDIIRVTRDILKETEFAAFGSDPKEELMLMERVLLQTIKFELMVEHPYSYLLRYAKQLKGDKEKKDKMVQMAWTFINDSLCTTLSLQWEPDIIGIAAIYLASRLSEFTVSEWEGKRGFKGKWFEFFVPDINMALIEDVCHQILDLYSSTQKNKESRVTEGLTSPATGTDTAKKQSSPAPVKRSSANNTPVPTAQPPAKKAAIEYGASFMSREGSANIQSLMAAGKKPAAASAYQPPVATQPSSVQNYCHQTYQASPASQYYPPQAADVHQKQYSQSQFQSGNYSSSYPQQHGTPQQSQQALLGKQPHEQQSHAPQAHVSPRVQQQHHSQARGQQYQDRSYNNQGYSQQHYSGGFQPSPAQQYQQGNRYGTPPQNYNSRHKQHAPGNPGMVRISR